MLNYLLSIYYLREQDESMYRKTKKRKTGEGSTAEHNKMYSPLDNNIFIICIFDHTVFYVEVLYIRHKVYNNNEDLTSLLHSLIFR